MKLKDLGEFGLIEIFAQNAIVQPNNVIKGIGDDAAVFTTSNASLLTTDLLLENVHFITKNTSGFALGHKALAVNLSDLAAMGAAPLNAFISIACPQDFSISYLEDFIQGVKSLASKYNVNILGGDTTSSKQGLVINIAITGQADKEKILYRNTAQEGDIIACTGPLGNSRAGLHHLLHTPENEHDSTLINAHNMPMPRIEDGLFLASTNAVNSAIDISDGLSSDLCHITDQSKTGAKIFAEKLPISDNLKQFCKKYSFDPIEYALSGGEDYELLVTINPIQFEKIAQAFKEKFHRPLFPIGEIVCEKTTELVYPDKESKVIKRTGWEHFRDEE